MATGTVKWFNPTKVFGFIQPDGGGTDVFVHVTAVQKAGLQGLDENAKVEYELEDQRGKTSAINLKVLYVDQPLRLGDRRGGFGFRACFLFCLGYRASRYLSALSGLPR